VLTIETESRAIAQDQMDLIVNHAAVADLDGEKRRQVFDALMEPFAAVIQVQSADRAIAKRAASHTLTRTVMPLHLTWVHLGPSRATGHREVSFSILDTPHAYQALRPNSFRTVPQRT